MFKPMSILHMDIASINECIPFYLRNIANTICGKLLLCFRCARVTGQFKKMEK